MEAFITYRTPSNLPGLPGGEPLDMPEEVFADYLDLLEHSDAGRAVIRGNEPVLHPDFARLTSALARRNIPPVIETTGLAGTGALRVVGGRNFEVILRLYHPAAYPDDDLGRAVRTGRELPPPARQNLHLRLLIDDPARDHGFLLELLPELQPVSLQVDLARPLPHEETEPLSRWLADELPEIARQGVGVRLDCALRPCGFSDADWGRLAKMGIHPDRCIPHPGVRPDGKVYHCRRMIDHAAGQISEYDTESEVVGFLYERYGNWQNRVDVIPDCEGCEVLEAGACVGECLVLKGRAMERQIEEYERQDFSDLSVPDIARLSGLYLAMQRVDEAERCLVAARRRHPEAGPVHLMLARVLRARGRTAEAKEEYEKAMRLMPGEGRVRAEAEQMRRG